MQTNTTYRKKDGSWQIIVSYKVGNTWKQKSRQGFATKAAAKESESSIIQSITVPVDKSITNITLADFCKEYLANRKSLSYATKTIYTYAVNSLQSVANKPMRTITYLDLQKAIREWKIAPAVERYSIFAVSYYRMTDARLYDGLVPMIYIVFDIFRKFFQCSHFFM